MAFIERLQLDNGSVEIFNVSHPIGAGAANFWTDIMLVQYLIRKIYLMNEFDGASLFGPLIREMLSDLPDPHTDFKALKKTERWIRRYQNDRQITGVKVAADGRVDSPRGFVPTNSGDNYTIHLLNQDFSFLARKTGHVNPLEDALTDPAMPAMLKGQLRTNLEV